MVITNSENCWEFMNCPEEIKTDCEVFKTHSGNECWFLMSLKKGCPASKKYGSCVNCSFYIKNNPKK